MSDEAMPFKATGLPSWVAFTKIRSDGWPMCPLCGEDELYSLAIPATIETIVGCYRCNWRPLPTP